MCQIKPFPPSKNNSLIVFRAYNFVQSYQWHFMSYSHQMHFYEREKNKYFMATAFEEHSVFQSQASLSTYVPIRSLQQMQNASCLLVSEECKDRRMYLKYSSHRQKSEHRKELLSPVITTYLFVLTPSSITDPKTGKTVADYNILVT